MGEFQEPVAGARRFYVGQCNRCFMISGRVVARLEDIPSCCGDEQMAAVEIIPRVEDRAEKGDIRRPNRN